MERAGHDVDVAANGKDGTIRYREHPADLVITDIVMPEQDGIETVIELRRDFPQVKIIAISGGGRFALESYLDMSNRLGADRTFAKPVDCAELLAAVCELLAEP